MTIPWQNLNLSVTSTNNCFILFNLNHFLLYQLQRQSTGFLMVCGGRGQMSNHIGGIASSRIRRKHQHGPCKIR